MSVALSSIISYRSITATSQTTFQMLLSSLVILDNDKVVWLWLFESCYISLLFLQGHSGQAPQPTETEGKGSAFLRAQIRACQ